MIDGTGLNEKICPVCGKIFYVKSINHGWTNKDKKKKIYLCSYKCMREYRK